MADLPEGRGVLTSLVLFGMGNTVMQESIFLTNGNSTTGLVLASVFFSFQIISFLVVSILLSAFHTKLHKLVCYIMFTLILQHTGAVFFFVGDNIAKLVIRYGGDVEAAQNTSTVLTVLALLIFWITPSLSHLFRETPLTNKENKAEYKTPEDAKHWCSALDTITVFVKVNVLYTAVLSMVGTLEDDCAASIPIYIVCVGIGSIYEVAKIIGLWFDKAIEYRKVVITVLVAIVGFICFPMYLLMNNTLPLDCALNCLENTTMPMLNGTSAFCGNQYNISAARLSVTLFNLLFLTAVSLIFGSVYLLVRFEKEDIKKLLPKCCTCEVRLWKDEDKDNWVIAVMEVFAFPVADHKRRKKGGRRQEAVLSPTD